MDYSNTTFLEYQKKKREMLDDLGRTSGMCNGVDCGECPFNKLSNNTHCNSFEMLYPEEALNALMSYEPKVDWRKFRQIQKFLLETINVKLGLKDILQSILMEKYMRMTMVQHHFLQKGHLCGHTQNYIKTMKNKTL